MANKLLRARYMAFINGTGKRIYSSANLKDGSHRLSIIWHAERYVDKERLKSLTKRLAPSINSWVARLEQEFPSLRGRLTWKLQSGAWVYVNLRIK